MSEKHIQAAIRLALGGREVLLWRNESGATVQVTRGELEALLEGADDPTFVKRILQLMLRRGVITYGLCKGSSDLIGLRRDGRFVALEVKAPGGRHRPEQERYVELVQSFKGLAGFVTSVEEARNIINAH